MNMDRKKGSFFCLFVFVSTLLLGMGCHKQQPSGEVKAPRQPTVPEDKKAEDNRETEDKLPDLFPHTKGSVWNFTATAEGSLYNIQMAVIEGKEENDSKSFLIETRLDKKPVLRERYLINKTGLYLVGYGDKGNEKIEPPLPLVKFPIVSGTLWDWKGEFRGAEGTSLGVAEIKLTGPEPLKTSAGVFKAYKVEQSITVTTPEASQTRLNTQWFALDVGLVQQKTENGGQKIDAELKSYSIK